MNSLGDQYKALVIGSSGAIGSAFVSKLIEYRYVTVKL